MYTAGHTKDAVECFHKTGGELGDGTYPHDEHLEWSLGERGCSSAVSAYVTFLSDFSQRSFKKLEHLGDAAVDTQQYDDGISYYTTALSLNPRSPKGILIKRHKAFLATESWQLALDDANKVHYFCVMQVKSC